MVSENHKLSRNLWKFSQRLWASIEFLPKFRIISLPSGNLPSAPSTRDPTYKSSLVEPRFSPPGKIPAGVSDSIKNDVPKLHFPFLLNRIRLNIYLYYSPSKFDLSSLKSKKCYPHYSDIPTLNSLNVSTFVIFQCLREIFAKGDIFSKVCSNFWTM